ncbi:unnamed protein product [Hyaloperonospora brassicae]|uniref:Uncharacterized protein n=1 Tax=Hyaloperonospora brassicae TaxID=162125 RepID=A0AAV0TXH5_HYABA|nr:unnamed protein product [Hyaloperonospora brassicae]
MESDAPPPRAFNAQSLSARWDRRTQSAPRDRDETLQLPPPVAGGVSAPAPARQATAGVATRGWRPGQGGGRLNSPLYGQHRKRPSSMDSNVSWSGSEIDSLGAVGAAHSDQEQVSRLSWASSVVTRDSLPDTEQLNAMPAASTLFGRSAVEQSRGVAGQEQTFGSGNGVGVQSPRTARDSIAVMDNRSEKKATQPVRVEVPVQQTKGPAGPRTSGSENVHVTPPPSSSSSSVYDEEKNGPQSCPSTFADTRVPHFSIEKLRQMRGTELVASTLLPTRASVNSLMGYVRELQLSEATLRKQLVKNKQHTEEELSMSLSKVGALERTMQEIERDRELARQKVEEQERLIRDLAAKLRQAEAAMSASSNVDGLSSIAEEAGPRVEGAAGTGTGVPNVVDATVDTTVVSPPTRDAPTQHEMPQEQSSSTPVQPDQTNVTHRPVQFASPSRSPERPLWDPWASEGVAAVTNHPPVFTIGSTEFDPVVSSSTPIAHSSMNSSATSAHGQYELKSVLASPRRVTPEAQNAAHSLQSENEISRMELPSRALPDTFAAVTPPGMGDLLEQKDGTSISPDGYATYTGGTGFDTFQGQPERRSSVSSAAPPTRFEGGTNEDVAALSSLNPAEFTTSMPPLQPPVEHAQSPLEPSSGTRMDTQVTAPEQGFTIGAENAFGVSSVPPSSVPPASPSFANKSEVADTTSFMQHDSSAAPTEPVSLETLLVDFFTEVDNKRLKMAKVYGKRYAGREKWLFAELTKRYGAAKVAVLKARFNTGSGGGGDVSADTSRTDSAEAQHATRPPDAPNHAEQGRRGHPQHTQFFHPPAPDGNVESATGAGPPSMSAPIADPHEMDASRLQSRQVAPEVETPPSPSESLSAGTFSSQQRHSGGDMPPPSGPYSSFPNSQETSGEVSAAVAGGKAGSAFKRGPFPMSQRRAEPFSHRPFPPQTETESSGAASLGLRQRRQASVSSQDGSGDAEPPVVTLESLLNELYKNHQPDKLKNVPAVAKQYAGKERELVALLKGKYGALSVKRLEESLDVLERAHLARLSSKATGKRRGCFVRTVSLVFWLSLLLYFSSGVVFVSFIVLDAWECHSLDSEEQELEGAEECSVLKKELETFTYERVADYMGQSHPDACFCSEWKARESALFANYSVEDAVNLARMVPFSPGSFGAPWVATVKAQVPSQEFVDSYVKPVVDLSLDVGSFVWTSVLELAESGMTSEELPVVEHDVDHGYGDASSLDEDGDTDEHADSHQQNAEADIDDLVGNDDADTLSMEEEEELVEDQPLAVTPGVLDQVFVEEISDVLDEKPEIEELDTRVAEAVLAEDEEVMSDMADEIDTTAPDGVLVESEDGIPAVGDVTTITGESLPSETKRDEQAAKESTDMLEVDDTLSLEMAGSIDASEQAASDEIEARADVEATSGGVVNNLAEDDESVGDADGESAETEVADAAITESTGGIDDASETEIAVLDDAADNVAVTTAEGAPEVAVEGNVETSTDDSVAEAERVVEVEVHQEGLDLLYPERESTEEADTASGEVSDSSMHVDLLPSLASGDASSISSEETAFVLPETSTADEGSATHTSSGADADADVTNVEPDVGVESDALEANGGHSDEETIEVSQTEHQAELSSELEFVTHDDDSSIPVDVDELELASGVEEDAPGSLHEEPEPDTDENGLADDIDAEVEVDAMPEDGEVTPFEGDGGGSLTHSQTEKGSDSDGVTAAEVLPADATAYLSDDRSLSIESDNEELAASAVVGELPSADDDGRVVETNEVDDDDPTVLDEGQEDSESKIEDDTASVDEDVVAQDLSEHAEHEDFGLVEDSGESLAAAAESDATTDEYASTSEAKVENFDEATDEMDEAGNEDTEATADRDIEAEEFAPEPGLVSELGEESMVAEGVDVMDDVEVVSAEHGMEVDEQVEIDETASVGAAEGLDDPIAAETAGHDDMAEGVVAYVAETEGSPPVDEVDPLSDDEEVNVVTTDGDSVAGDEAVAAEVASITADSDDATDATDEAPHADTRVHVDDETTESVVDESSAPVSAEETDSSLTSAMNEVLAKLVEPFTAAKTDADVATTGSEHRVDEL